MSTKLLTIIIPAYNMEKLLPECIDSLLVETELINFVEIIIVNDGSTDNTSCIAEEYANKFPQIVRVINKENGGHGSAVNCGIANAIGKYFRVLDADDWFDGRAYVRYLNELVRADDPDVFINAYVSVDEITGIKTWHTFNLPEHKKNKLIKIEDFLDGNYLGMSMITFKTSILKDNNIRLDEKMYYADVEYVHFTLPYVNTCWCSELFLYRYRVNQEQQSCSMVGYQKHREDHKKMLKQCIDSKNSHELISEIKKKYIERNLMVIILLQYKIYFSSLLKKHVSKQLAEFDDMLKEKSEYLYNLCEKDTYVKLYRNKYWKVPIVIQLMYKWDEWCGKNKKIGV